MSTKRIIFYSLFGAYQLVAFVFTVVMGKFLLSLLPYVPYFKYVSFVGVVLISIDFLWALQQGRKKNKEAVESRNQDTLKAKIYDFQQPEKQTVATGSK